MTRQVGRATAAALAAATVALVVALTVAFSADEGPDRGPSGAEAPRRPVHFTAAGDYGTSPETREVLDLAKGLGPDLHLALGDLSYGERGDEPEWCAMVRDHVGPDLPFELLSGNHESDGRNGHIDEFVECLPSRLPGLVGTYGREWYADVPAEAPVVRLVMISAGLTYTEGRADYSEGSPSYRWTEAAIRGAREAAIPWVIVGLHKPCLSLGEYECDPGTDLHDLLLRERVDLVLHGHEHLYQRTHQLALGPSCRSVVPEAVDGDCVADRAADYEQGGGTIFATVGTGGIGLRDVHTDDPEAGYFATAVGKQTPTWGVLEVRATPTALSARFVPTAGGTFEDRFAIVGEGAVVPQPGEPSAEPSRPRRPATPTAGRLAVDTFDRDVGTGFGTAELGGDWRTEDGESDYRVDRGVGRVTLDGPGADADLSLPGVSSTRTDLVHAFAVDRPISGSGLYASVSARRVPDAGEYRANVRLVPGGDVVLTLAHVVDGTERVRTNPRSVRGVTHDDARQILVRTEVSGTDPTTVRARVWQEGTPEPTDWLLSMTDSTRSLQAPGSIGIGYYLSRSATDAPVTVLVDDVVAREP